MAIFEFSVQRVPKLGIDTKSSNTVIFNSNYINFLFHTEVQGGFS